MHMSSTNLISGLASGFDWRSMIDQLIAIDNERVQLVDSKKSEYESKLSEWQSFNTKLLALKTAAENLSDPDDFMSFSTHMTTDSTTVKASDLISVTTSSSAAVGAYSIVIEEKAAAQRLSSNSFTSLSDALGTACAGDIIINGVTITIDAGDSLTDIRDSINNANSGSTPSGVTAGIVSYGENDYRLSLTNDATGADGISLLNGGAGDILNALGFIDTSRVAKNHLTGGDRSDGFTSSVVAVQTLLGLNDAGTSSENGIVINGAGVAAIDLATDTLTTIAQKFVDAGINASVVSETVDNEVTYRLFIEGGANTYTDEQNILETLGIIRGGLSDLMGVEGDIENTSAGAAITEDTLINAIDGYTGFAAGDYLYLNGTRTDGTTTGLPDTSLVLSDTTTVQDLLDTIESLFGDVTASVTGDGKLRIADNGSGESTLAVQVSVKNAGGSDETTLSFESDGDMGTAVSLRAREVVAGSDASISIDGVEITSSDNSITDAISGVTIDLLKADADTTVSLDVTRNLSAVKSKINSLVTSYNSVMSYIQAQQSYDTEEKTTGGILFGDGTLSSVKSDLTTTLLETVWGVSSEFSILGLAGINVDEDGMLSVDSDTLTEYLETNFNDITLLFTANGTATGSDLEYISSGAESTAGDYTIHIDQAASQATRTGSVDLSGGLSENITLSITESGHTAQVALTAGMSLDEIIEAINTETDRNVTETLVGAVRLYEGTGQSSAMTAQTTWDEVYVGGNSANLQDGDVIAFSGTNRSGQSISGTYALDDASSDTVQGLLSAIESSFSGAVSASIDASGRIVITDTSEGASQLSLSFDYSGAHQLTFGSVDATPDAGDGSREGRWAVPVTASNDGSGHLVLTHDYYGSNLGFTLSQTGATDYREIALSNTALTTAASSGQILADGSTTWDGIFGSDTGETDTITIAGTTHDGTDVGPQSYSIYGAGSYKDVDSLLTAIEAAFTAAGGSVDTRIEDGKIVVEDMETGEGSLLLTLTCNNEGAASDLDLGLFDEESMATHDLTLGLTGGAVYGLDVVGAINGDPASGSGQILTAESGATEGISVKYGGTAAGIDAGTVRLTTGVAELFDRVLQTITDPIDGYVAFKKESLSTSIESFEEQIDRMTELLNRKMETMISRFVAMELAISEIQSQSSWLSSQISTLFDFTSS